MYEQRQSIEVWDSCRGVKQKTVATVTLCWLGGRQKMRIKYSRRYEGRETLWSISVMTAAFRFFIRTSSDGASQERKRERKKKTKRKRNENQQQQQRKNTMARAVRGLHALVIVWFVVSTLIVAIDGIYIFYRPQYIKPTPENPNPQQLPHPLRKNPFVGGWDMYAAVDHRYQPSEDSSFLNTILVGNVIEGVLMALAVFYSIAGATVKSNAVSFAVNIMIFYKTIVYYTLNIMEGGKHTAHVSNNELIWMFYVPALPWFIFPLLCVVSNVRRIKAAGYQQALASSKKAN